nr:piezo-type mechanosensitive ion channel component 1-like [Pelodiscus sinensis]|eukprot:XP_025038298.1 piezo-type mechanosensitive ion channel component 1-like [Pelodiscus sinensis]
MGPPSRLFPVATWTSNCVKKAERLLQSAGSACVFRINALSLVYLLYLLLLPWFLGPTEHTITGHTGRLLQALLGTSVLFLIAHLVFQICLYTVPGLDQLLGQNCSTWETLARHIGVTRLDLTDIPNSVRLVAPDVGILLVSAICLGLGRRLVARGRTPESLEPGLEVRCWRQAAPWAELAGPRRTGAGAGGELLRLRSALAVPVVFQPLRRSQAG